MSIGICGQIKLVYNNINEHIELAYLIQKYALDKGIGCKLGGNVSRHVYERYSENEKMGTFLFEVMDSPLDNYSNILFYPTIEANSNNYEQEFDIKISNSLEIMHDFLKSILMNSIVEFIYLDFNYLLIEDEEIVDINIDSISNYLSNLYTQEEYATPVIRMKITL